MKLSDYLKNRRIPWESVKALSVRQPAASLIVTGEKTIEWRSYPLSYRGPMVICASLTLANPSGKDLPRGVALGIVDVIGCRPFTKHDLAAARCLDYLEYIYGPPEGFAWLLADAHECEPVPVKGIVAPWPWHKRGGHDIILTS